MAKPATLELSLSPVSREGSVQSIPVNCEPELPGPAAYGEPVAVVSGPLAFLAEAKIV